MKYKIGDMTNKGKIIAYQCNEDGSNPTYLVESVTILKEDELEFCGDRKKEDANTRNERT